MILLTGCSKEQEVEPTKPEPVFWEETTSEIKPGNPDITYSKGEKIPLIRDGKFVGVIKVNWIQKIRISDHTNTDAKNKGINYSFSVNSTVNFTKVIDKNDGITVSVKAYLVKDGKSVGVPGHVGWSGFNNESQLFKKTPRMTAETIIQPIQSDLEGANIVLRVSDDKGGVYDDIKLSDSWNDEIVDTNTGYIRNGAKIIRTVNGAKFSISIKRAYHEMQFYKKNTTNTIEAVDYEYVIKYLKAPTNKRKDGMFEGNRLKTKFISYVMLGTNLPLYDEEPELTQYVYSNSDEVQSYATTEYPELNVGESFVVHTNRLVEGNVGRSRYAYIVFEFPEEAIARNLNELKKFNGRYVVFKEKFKKRKLPKNKELSNEAYEW